MKWRVWVLIGVLGALAGALRIPFAFLPNVQPATALIIVAGLALGPRIGLGVGVLVPLVSNTFLGHGPWTLVQIVAWGLVGVASGFLPRLGRWTMAAWGVIASFAFGLLMDGWIWLAFAHPRQLSTLVPVLAQGLPFNIAHAATTFGVLAWAGPRLQSLLMRARVRILGDPHTDPVTLDGRSGEGRAGPRASDSS